MPTTQKTAVSDSHQVMADVQYGIEPQGRQITPATLLDLSVKEIILAESLLTPGLQTTVKFHSMVHQKYEETIKDFDGFKNAILNLKITRPVLKDFNFREDMLVRQRIYRVSNRKQTTQNIEELTVSACDDSLLNDARSLVSKSWKCTSPAQVVRDVLTQCAKIPSTKLDIETENSSRSYIADNIHPFQVVAEQANAALANGNDPSFIHYMTYDNFGTHHFRSLAYLIKQTPVATFNYAEGSNYAVPTYILKYEFPCDFDLLSDILNGIDVDGKEINTVAVLNPYSGQSSLFGGTVSDCGIGMGNIIHTVTNQGTAEEHNMCNSNIEKFRLRRQARMNLLEQDKIALRMTVPWNPDLHAGKTVDVNLYLKKEDGLDTVLYGSGRYLIASMVHNIKAGGYSTTTMDCISQTAAQTGAV